MGTTLDADDYKDAVDAFTALLGDPVFQGFDPAGAVRVSVDKVRV
jgi:hypothetical protein